MFRFFKKINFRQKSNIITFIDVVIILFIFIFAKNYYKLTSPTSESIEKDKVKYTLSINKYKYSLNEIMFINFEIKNKTKKKKEINITKENIIKIDILDENENILYSNDYINRNRDVNKKINIAGYGKINIGNIWDFKSDIYNNIGKGEYKLRAIFHDMDVEIKIPFIIE